MKIGIIIVGTNAYFALALRFIKRFMHFYKGKAEIVFHLFTDTDPRPYLPDSINVIYHYTTHSNWVDATNSKFTNIISLEESYNDEDFKFYFDSDTNIDKEFTEDWFLGELVGGQHYGDQSWMKERKSFDRNPLSKAYVPENTPLPQMYYYGAFFGGSKSNIFEFCKTLVFYQKEDKKISYEPGVNDESYINAYFHYNPPTYTVPTEKFEFLISDKGGFEEIVRISDVDISSIKKELLENKDKLFNLVHKKIVYE
jgi:hypothetical protein